MAKKKVVAGRGKKTCPKCGAIVGVRTAICTTSNCNYAFPFKSKTDKNLPTSEPSSLRGTLVAEKARLEELLKNRQRMEQRLKAIDHLLQTMDD